MLHHQGVELFDRIRKVRRSGLIGRSVSLVVGLEVSKAQPGSVSWPPALPASHNVALKDFPSTMRAKPAEILPS